MVMPSDLAFLAASGLAGFAAGCAMSYQAAKIAAKEYFTAAAKATKRPSEADRWMPCGGYEPMLNGQLLALSERNRKLQAENDRLKAGPPKPRDWLATSWEEVRFGLSGDPYPRITMEPPLGPQKGDMRVVELTVMVPHLFLLERWVPAHHIDNQYGKRDVPARWVPTRYGKYENGLFETEQDARAAAGRAFVVDEIRPAVAK